MLILCEAQSKNPKLNPNLLPLGLRVSFKRSLMETRPSSLNNHQALACTREEGEGILFLVESPKNSQISKT